jgi:hypothetical protein
MRTAFLIFCLFLTTLTYSQIRINEVLPSNVNGILDEDQEFSDWIEVSNFGDVPVDITGWSLSDDRTIPMKWTFPVLTLPPHHYMLVFASDKNRKSLPMSMTTIIEAGDEWKYIVPDSDIGAGWHEPEFVDNIWLTGPGGFGYGDNDDSTIVESFSMSVFIRKEFNFSDFANLGRLVLSVDFDDGFVAYINGHEVARSNLGSPGEYIAFDTPADGNREAVLYSGGAPIHFEIENPSAILVEGKNVLAIQVHNNAASSSDLSLIPFLTTGRLTNEINSTPDCLVFSEYGELHTNFKIDADSDNVYLFNSSGVLIDSVGVISIPKDVSVGRYPDGSNSFHWFGIPSPLSANKIYASGLSVSDSVSFSPGGGMVPPGTAVSLLSPYPADSIYYTLDGSVPDTSDLIYSGPVTITGSKVIRARVIRFDELPGPVVSKTYTTNFEHDIPVICLSTEPSNLWDINYGIYAFGPNTPTVEPYPEANYWKDWERPVFIEYYDTDGIQKIGQEAGIKIFGAYSRSFNQKSLSLFARNSYGKGSFKYQFFADKPVDKFESLILRNSGNDNMGLQFHDCFMTGLTRDMNTDRQAYQPTAVYLNGEYWGLLNMREKISTNYVSNNHHVNADSVNLLEGGGNAVDGTNVHYSSLINYLNTKSTLQNDADYIQVRDKIDMDNYIQYQLTQIYLNNRDWPGNNIKFWNSTAIDSKWRWILFDTDFGYGIWNVEDYQVNTLAFALETNGPGWPNPPWATLLFRRLTSNLNFRNNFIIQFCDRLNLDFHPDRVNADLDSLTNLYYNEIGYNFDRWWGNYDEWNWRISNRRTFGENRPYYCRRYMREEFLLGTTLNVNLDVTGHGEGKILLNTITPEKYPFSGIYFTNIPITLKAIPAPGYRFVQWEGSSISTDPQITYDMKVSGSFSAVFTEASAEDFSVIINEINYSSASERNTKDWVEIYNNGNTTVDLSGWLLIDSNVDSGYVFPEGRLLIPGEYLVVCRDIEDFKNLNPNVAGSLGDMLFGLSSEGDMVRLFDQNHNLIDAVNYGVFSPWPEEANGSGFTLELKVPDFNNMLSDSWQAVAYGGTPGKENSPWLISSVVENQPELEVFDCYPNPFSDFVTITFDINANGKYRLEIIDMQGRVVAVPVDQTLEPGTYWFDWSGPDRASSGGVYTVRLSGDKVLKVKRIISLK